MKIAMLVRGYIPVPRPTDMIYAPIDLAVTIAEGLTQRGHQVDFFAPTSSRLFGGVNVESLDMRPLVRDQASFLDIVSDPGLQGHIQPALWDERMSAEMFRRATLGQYDLLHFHHAETAWTLARKNLRTPVVYTIHDPLAPWYRELFEMYQSPNQHYISISDNQRRDAPDLPYAATVHNGVDPNFFPFSDEAEDYLLIAGRIVPGKGYKEAIEIAQRTNQRLLIIGPVNPDMQGYFDQYIKPHLNDKILYLGPMEQDQLVKYYQKAKAFITPVQWEEPFGLTTIEAMACGTPVISLKRGAAQEIIKHGKTGYLVDSMAEMGRAIKKIDKIDRAACRAHVEQNFSNELMIDAYEKTFQSIIAANTIGRLQRRVTGAATKAVSPVKKVAKNSQRKSATAKRKASARAKQL